MGKRRDDVLSRRNVSESLHCLDSALESREEVQPATAAAGSLARHNACSERGCWPWTGLQDERSPLCPSPPLLPLSMSAWSSETLPIDSWLLSPRRAASFSANESPPPSEALESPQSLSKRSSRRSCNHRWDCCSFVKTTSSEASFPISLDSPPPGPPPGPPSPRT